MTEIGLPILAGPTDFEQHRLPDPGDLKNPKLLDINSSVYIVQNLTDFNLPSATLANSTKV